jgi:lysophospholipase L1-like esterase
MDMLFSRFHQRIREKIEKPSEKPILIGAFGDSLTLGATKLGVIDHEGVFHHQLWKMLITQFPKCVFSTINLGVGGQTATIGLGRAQEQLIPLQPDLVLLGFCANDCLAGPEGIPEYRKSMSKIIDLIQSKTQADLILLTPNFLCSRLSDQVAEEHKKIGLPEKFIPIQRDGILKQYVQVVRELGNDLGVPVADVYAQWEKMEKQGVDTTALLINGLNHPGRDGHAIAARLIFEALMR